MCAYYLHCLDELPESGAICVLGERGRNSRFITLLSVHRPEIKPSRVVDLPTRTSGPECCSLEVLLSRIDMSAFDLILITSGKHKHVSAFLNGRGIGPYLILNPNFAHPFLQPGTEEHLPDLEKAKSLFPFEQDRQFYDLIVSAIRVKADLREIYLKLNDFHSRMGRQYLDFIVPSAVQTVVEGGVEDGRNTVQFLGSFPEAVIHGFEPDRDAFAESYFRQYLEDHPRVRISTTALWNGSTQLSFEGGRTGRSKISGEGASAAERVVSAVSIDEYVLKNGIRKVDFIKLDIEGSELEALRGAVQVLRGHRPQLAVCMYHLLEHYHEIPSFLAGCAADYVLRVGHYSARYLFSETVLYAIPRELYDTRTVIGSGGAGLR